MFMKLYKHVWDLIRFPTKKKLRFETVQDCYLNMAVTSRLMLPFSDTVKKFCKVS